MRDSVYAVRPNEFRCVGTILGVVGEDDELEGTEEDGLLRAFVTVTILSLVVAVIASTQLSRGRTVEEWDSLSYGTQLSIQIGVGMLFFILAPVPISLLFYIFPIKTLGFRNRGRPAGFFGLSLVGAVAGAILIARLDDEIDVTWKLDEEDVASQEFEPNQAATTATTKPRQAEKASPLEPTQEQKFSDPEKAEILDGYFSSTEYGPLLREMGFTGDNATLFVEGICEQFDKGSTAEEVRLQIVGGFSDEPHKAEAIISFYAAGVELYCPDHNATIRGS